MRRFLALTLIAIMGLSVIGFAQDLGTQGNPITLLLVPSTEAAVVQAAGDAIADAMFDLTGLYVEAVMTADYRAFIEAFAASDGDVLGIPTTSQYIEIYAETDGAIEVAPIGKLISNSHKRGRGRNFQCITKTLRDDMP